MCDAGPGVCGSGDARGPVLDASVRGALALTYSGFHTHHPARAGWRFLEARGAVPGGGADAEVGEGDWEPLGEEEGDWPGAGEAGAEGRVRPLWLAGTSEASTPPFTPSVFHAAQVRPHLAPFVSTYLAPYLIVLHAAQVCPYLAMSSPPT